MRVREIMTKNPAYCMPDAELSDVAQMMVDRDCGEIPVLNDPTARRPIGVVTDRDLVVRTIAEGRNPIGMTASEVMSTPAITVTPDDDVEECCRILEDHQIRRVPVVDDTGACCGMVSQADVALHAPAKTTGEVVKMVSKPD